MRTVLFTGGGGAGNESLWRLLGDRYELHFADADPAAIDPSIPEERRHRIPMADDPQFSSRVLSLVDKLGVDLVVPAVDEELVAVADLAEKGLLRALVPPRAFVERNLDKLLSANFLAEHNLAAPRTAKAECAEEIGFPCIVKPRSGRGSRNVALIHSQAELEAYLAYMGQQRGAFIAQEYGKGQEFTVLMAADSRGVLNAIVPVVVGLKRGITLRAKTSRDPLVIGVCSQIHAADPVPGCYNIQLVHDDERALVFEINPRVSTTFCLGVASGVDPISIFLDGVSGAVGEIQDFKTEISLQRYWHNHFSGESHG